MFPEQAVINAHFVCLSHLSFSRFSRVMMSLKRTAPPRLMGKVTMATIPHLSPLTPHLPFALLLSSHVKKTFHTIFILWTDNLLLSINLLNHGWVITHPFKIKGMNVTYCPLDGVVPFEMHVTLAETRQHAISELEWMASHTMCVH